MKKAFKVETEKIQKKYKKTKSSVGFYWKVMLGCNGQAAFLPAYLKIDGYTRGLGGPANYKTLGEEWAAFAFWQKLERRRRFWKITWDRITKVGAVLAIMLTVLILLEVFVPE